MKNSDKDILELDKKYEELEKEEQRMLQKKNKTINIDKDQSEKAINTIKECVNELIEIKDLKLKIEENEQEYKNILLTIVSWFMYLKDKKNGTTEYNEAKNMIKNLGFKHKELSNWCENLINKSITKKNDNYIEVELNVNKESELVVRNNLKILVDTESVKKFIDTKGGIGTPKYNNLELKYTVIIDEKKYDFIYHIVNNIPKCESFSDSPYIVNLIEHFKNEKNEYILRFSIFEKVKYS